LRTIALISAVGLLLAGLVAMLRTSPTSPIDVSFAAIAWAGVVVCTALLVAGALLIVAVIRRTWRPPAAAAAGIVLAATIVTFPVQRRWFDSEYSSGMVPLAQSLTMQRLPGSNGGTTDGWFRPPTFAYTETCCS
jgi:hypothetical protein